VARYDVEIDLPSATGVGGRLAVGDHDLSSTTSGFTLRLPRAGEPAMLTVDLFVDKVSVRAGDVRVVVPETTALALVALGWTPPAKG
jgi:hypothetical protein